jgi:hypothetical protein
MGLPPGGHRRLLYGSAVFALVYGVVVINYVDLTSTGGPFYHLWLLCATFSILLLPVVYFRYCLELKTLAVNARRRISFSI